MPAFLRIDTYRLMAHSKGDDDREPQEVQAYWDKDPLTLFMQEHDQEDIAQITAQHAARIDGAVACAESRPSCSSRGSTDEEVPPCAWPEVGTDAMHNLRTCRSHSPLRVAAQYASG